MMVSTFQIAFTVGQSWVLVKILVSDCQGAGLPAVRPPAGHDGVAFYELHPLGSADDPRPKATRLAGTPVLWEPVEPVGLRAAATEAAQTLAGCWGCDL